MFLPLCRQTDTESPGQAISLHTAESPANQNGVSDRLGIVWTKIDLLKLKWACHVTPGILGHLSLGGFTLCIFSRNLSLLNWPLIIELTTTVAGEDHGAMLGLRVGLGEGRTRSLSSPCLEEHHALRRALTKAGRSRWGGGLSVGSATPLPELFLLHPAFAVTKSVGKASQQKGLRHWATAAWEMGVGLLEGALSSASDSTPVPRQQCSQLLQPNNLDQVVHDV